MMRSWGNRSDTFVCDEPLYAHYLLKTELAHPGLSEVIAHHESDWRKVVSNLTGPIPEGKRVYYQKHMAHHLLPEIERNWMDQLTHVFLIRDPAEMLPSLTKFFRPTLSDTGLPQQVEIFESERARCGALPPVIDAKDVLENPKKLLGALCDILGLEFEDSMLSWNAGRRETDGIWAKHWYAAVEKSTGFEPYRAPRDAVPFELQPLLEECKALYHQLYQHRLMP